MLIYSCYFDHAFERFANVLRASIRKNCPDAALLIEDIGPQTDMPLRNPRHVMANAHKLRYWNRAVQEANDDLVLIDTDTLVLRDLQSAFNAFAFDVAITTRPGPVRTNAGIAFVRPTDAAKAFFTEWLAINERILQEHDSRKAMRARLKSHGGINQAALDELLERGTEADVAELPCSVWNCVDQTWDLFDPEGCAVVHYKARLRRATLGTQAPGHASNANLAALVRLWRKYDEAVRAPRAVPAGQ